MLCWTLAGEPPETAVRSTDKAPISELLKRLRKASDALPERDLADMLSVTAETAAHLFEIRHTIVHGRPMLSAEGGSALIRNPSWVGEARRRPTTSVILTDEILDLTADIALSVSQVVAGLSMVIVGEMPLAFALEREPEIRRCRDQAGAVLVTEVPSNGASPS